MKLTRHFGWGNTLGVTLALLLLTSPLIAEDRPPELPQAEGKPKDAKPTEARPSDSKATEAKSSDTKANEAKPSEARQAESAEVAAAVDPAAPADRNAERAAKAQAPAGSIEACFEAFEQSQVHLKDGDLLEAVELAERCSRGCPEEITSECRALRSQIDRDMPTALLLARTERGTDATEIVIQIDGEPRLGVLGEEIPLNPGPHTILFSRSDGWNEEVDIVVRRSEKRRQIRVVVPDRRTAGSPFESAQPPPKKSLLRPLSIGALALGGAGLATMTVAGIVALNRKANLDDDCSGNRCDQDRVDQRSDAIQDWLIVGDVGLAVGIVGIVSGASLLIWEATSKKDPQRAQVTLNPTWGGASAQISGHF